MLLLIREDRGSEEYEEGLMREEQSPLLWGLEEACCCEFCVRVICVGVDGVEVEFKRLRIGDDIRAGLECYSI